MKPKNKEVLLFSKLFISYDASSFYTEKVLLLLKIYVLLIIDDVDGSNMASLDFEVDRYTVKEFEAFDDNFFD